MNKYKYKKDDNDKPMNKFKYKNDKKYTTVKNDKIGKNDKNSSSPYFPSSLSPPNSPSSSSLTSSIRLLPSPHEIEYWKSDKIIQNGIEIYNISDHSNDKDSDSIIAYGKAEININSMNINEMKYEYKYENPNQNENKNKDTDKNKSNGNQLYRQFLIENAGKYKKSEMREAYKKYRESNPMKFSQVMIEKNKYERQPSPFESYENEFDEEIRDLIQYKPNKMEIESNPSISPSYDDILVVIKIILLTNDIPSAESLITLEVLPSLSKYTANLVDNIYVFSTDLNDIEAIHDKLFLDNKQYALFNQLIGNHQKFDFIINDLAGQLTLHEAIIRNMNSPNILELVKEVLIQIAYTLIIFERVGFQHNDLHDKNIMITFSESDETLYYSIPNASPNKNQLISIQSNLIIKIIDFEGSSKRGTPINSIIIDNPKLNGKRCDTIGDCNTFVKYKDWFTILYYIYKTAVEYEFDNQKQFTTIEDYRRYSTFKSPLRKYMEFLIGNRLLSYPIAFPGRPCIFNGNKPCIPIDLKNEIAYTYEKFLNV